MADNCVDIHDQQLKIWKMAKGLLPWEAIFWFSYKISQFYLSGNLLGIEKSRSFHKKFKW